MKDLRNLEGAKMLSKMEQRSIKGGEVCHDCPDWSDCCIGEICGIMAGPNGICTLP